MNFKRLEFSESLDGPWKVQGMLPEDRAQEAWAELQKWIQEAQVFGFFRLVNVSEAELISLLEDNNKAIPEDPMDKAAAYLDCLPKQD